MVWELGTRPRSPFSLVPLGDPRHLPTASVSQPQRGSQAAPSSTRSGSAEKGEQSGGAFQRGGRAEAGSTENRGHERTGCGPRAWCLLAEALGVMEELRGEVPSRVQIEGRGGVGGSVSPRLPHRGRGFCRAGLWEPWLPPLCGCTESLGPASLFLAISLVSASPVSGFGKTKVVPLGTLVSHLAVRSQGTEVFPAREFPAGTEKRQPEGETRQKK